MGERHLRKLESHTAIVGIDIPEVLEIGEESIDLERKLFRALEEGTEEAERELRTELTSLFSKVRSDLEGAEGPEAERLLEIGLIIKKALTILVSPLDRSQEDDSARWIAFVKKIRHD